MQPLLVYLAALTVHAAGFQVHAPLRVHSQSQNSAASTMRSVNMPPPRPSPLRHSYPCLSPFYPSIQKTAIDAVSPLPSLQSNAIHIRSPRTIAQSRTRKFFASRLRARTPWVKKLPEDTEREAVEAPIEMESSEQYEFSPEPNVIRDAYGNVVGSQSQRPAPDIWGMGSTLVIGNDEISYTAVRGARQPAILYLSAFDSPSRDFKAERIQRYCEREEYSFISMEWYGVGESDGDFEQGTISRWKQDAMTLISKLLPHQYQKLVIVGGGVGGWIATLIGLELPNKVTGIVGLAADPDFTHNLLLRYLPRNKMEEIETKGMAIIQWGQTSYPVTKRLIEDASENLVLQGPVGGLPIHCPVRLIHGLDDEEVPYTVSLDLARRLASPNVNLYLVKTANHHLDNTAILDTLIDSIEEVIANAPIEPQRNDIV